MKKLLVLTGGSFAGRRLYVPSTGVRPATNLVREAIFSTLGSFFEEGIRGRTVLDLFAGSGSLGLEALSRGARRAVFVDRSREALRSIRKNLDILGFAAEVAGEDAVRFLKKNRKLDFDVVFMDPPYRYMKTADVVEQLAECVLPTEGSLLIYERLYSDGEPDFGGRVRLLKRRRYGQSEILYFRVEGETRL